jgi:hypothetical protein
VLHEYVRVCEQVDDRQPKTAAAIGQLKSLNMQKDAILAVVDEVKAALASTQQLLFESQLEHPGASWQLCLDAIIQQNLRLVGMNDSENVLLDTSNENLFHLWLEKFNENRERYNQVDLCHEDL